jgi:2-phosphosulfolactate phosphatase
MPNIVCEWGLAGIEAWKAQASVFIIVDVLSFSTAVSVSVERGALVIPFPYGNAEAAAKEAVQQGAIAASPRRTGSGQLSLSPASLRELLPGTRLLLPSPNGSRLSLTTANIPTISGCLRNVRAVAALASHIAGDGTIAVIPAGERWPDQSLRPAIEDWLGAGAIIAALAGQVNAEAELAAQAYRAMRSQLGKVIRESISGRELIDGGYEADVELALKFDAASIAPIMRNGAYEAS